MATHELYLGGAARGDGTRAQFPSPAFSASDAAIKAMTPAAHKGPVTFALTRTLDFDNDPALAHYVANNTIANGDVLDLVVIPANTILLGAFVWVESPSGVASSTMAVKVGSTAFGTAVALDSEGSSFATPALATAGVTAGTVDLSTATFSNVPTVMSGTLTITDEGDLKGLRVHVSPVVIDPMSGQY